jgi:hypothetical protein
MVILSLISRITIDFKYRTCQIKFNFTHVDRSTLLHIKCIYINDGNTLKTQIHVYIINPIRSSYEVHPLYLQLSSLHQ